MDQQHSGEAKMFIQKSRYVYGVAIAALLAATSATAQDASASRSKSVALEEIVVTAQRRAERLEDVPISITAASGETLKAAGITSVEDITQIAPGVQMGRTGIIPQPSIRGVTSFLVSTGAENNIAVYVDGFYRPIQNGLYFDLANVAQVSVLKGPQGTLFGRNATGGAVMVETLSPSLTERSGKAGVSYGRYNDRKAYLYLTSPISDKAAFNISGQIHKSNGYIKDVQGFNTGPTDSYNLNTKLLLKPTDKLKITLGFDSVQTNDGRSLAITADGRVLAPVLFPGSYVEYRDNRTSLTHPLGNKSHSLDGTMKIEYDLGNAKITSLTRYEYEHDFTNYDIDLSAAQIFDQYLTYKHDDYQQEFNIASTGPGRFNYVAGVFHFYWDARTENNNLLSFPSRVYVPQNLNNIKTKADAAYVDFTWEAVDHLFLTGGVRYNHEIKELWIRTPTGADVIVPHVKDTYDSVTPRAVLRYQITPGSNVYASYSKGFKSGSINTAAPYNSIRPEKLDAYEVGYKYAGGRMRFDAATYYYNYTDLQVSSLALINGLNTAITTNAASAEIYGAEAQLTASVNENLNVRASVAYNHARYKKFLAPVNVVSAATGRNTGTCGTSPCSQDQSGQPLVRSPDWTFNLGGDYTVPLEGGSALVFTSNLTYTSSYAPSKSDKPLPGASGVFRYGQGAFALLNLSAAWRAPDGRLTVTAYGNNVTNTRYYTYRTGNAFGDYHVLGQPATWGARADYAF
jgi:iron complex outermembrane receptor protein